MKVKKNSEEETKVKKGKKLGKMSNRREKSIGRN
jgi:hypothetical protein